MPIALPVIRYQDFDALHGPPSAAPLVPLICQVPDMELPDTEPL